MLSSTDPTIGVAPRQPKLTYFVNRTGGGVPVGGLVVLDLEAREATDWNPGNGDSVWASVVSADPQDHRHGNWVVATKKIEPHVRGQFALWGSRLVIRAEPDVPKPSTRIWAPGEGMSARIEPGSGTRCLGIACGSGPKPPCIFNGWEPLWGFAPDVLVAAPDSEREFVDLEC